MICLRSLLKKSLKKLKLILITISIVSHTGIWQLKIQILSSLTPISRSALQLFSSKYFWLRCICTIAKHFKIQHSLQLPAGSSVDSFCVTFVPPGLCNIPEGSGHMSLLLHSHWTPQWLTNSSTPNPKTLCTAQCPLFGQLHERKALPSRSGGATSSTSLFQAPPNLFGADMCVTPCDSDPCRDHVFGGMDIEQNVLWLFCFEYLYLGCGNDLILVKRDPALHISGAKYLGTATFRNIHHLAWKWMSHG